MTKNPLNTETHKYCRKCDTVKPRTEFYGNQKNHDKLQGCCKECSKAWVNTYRATERGTINHRKSSKNWREKNVGRHADNNARWRYGVEHGTYDAMLAAQNGKCMICETTEPGSNTGRFAIDHCHNSNVVRGLLCHHCNRGLGLYRDSPALLRRAANYLENQPKVAENAEVPSIRMKN